MKQFALSLILLALMACTGSSDENDSLQVDYGVLADKQILRRGNGAEPQTLDPHKAEGVPASNILRDLYEGLVSEAPDGTLIPGAAASWNISADGTVYTFHLRPHARWSNGDALNAEDFVFGFRRSVDPTTGSHYAQILSMISNASEVIAGHKPPTELAVTAVDHNTLQIKLNALTPYFLSLLTHSTTYPVHKASLTNGHTRFARAGQLIGNGAYQLTDWVVQSHITLQRNVHYWDNTRTHINEVTYFAIDDSATELNRYRAGELDWTESVPLNRILWIRQHLDSELKISPYLGTYYYGFNLTRPPFKDNPGLRKALSMAIDREIITEKLTQLGELPAYGWVPPGVLNYQSQNFDYQELGREARHAEAQWLYQQAGYSKNNPLRIQLRYNTSDNHKKIAIVIAAMWKKTLGVNTELLNEEWKVFLKNRREKQVTQVFRAGWIGDYNDAATFAELLHSSFGVNDYGYHNPEYDALLSQAAQEPNLQQRRLYLQTAEMMLLNDHPVMPIYFYVSKSLIKPYVDGYVGNIMDHHYTKHFRIFKH